MSCNTIKKLAVPQPLLAPYRVLDFTDEKGFICGKILAELGADVLKIEPPGGDASRRFPPFHKDIPHPEKSLFWLAFNTSKRGVTLNIEAEEGRGILHRLAQKADFFVESFPPGFLDRLGLSYGVLSAENPRLIMVSITPFGQNGPHSSYKGDDLVAEAMGGLMYVTGNPDRAPVYSGFGYAYNHAGGQAAVAALMALYRRGMTGRGQHIDLSVQEAVLVTMYLPQHLWQIYGTIQGRHGDKCVRGKNSVMRIIYPCKDGFVMWRPFTSQLGPLTHALVKWMEDEGMGGGVSDVDWETVDMDKVTQDALKGWEEAFSRFFLTKTSSELYLEGIKRGIMVFPVNNARQVLADRQLAARGFWTKVEYPHLGIALTHPGIPFKASESLVKVKLAPRIGEHNHDVYVGELGLDDNEVKRLEREGVV